MRKNKGFTLVEVLVVVCILGVLAALILPLASCSVAPRQISVPVLKGPVNDYADILTPAEEQDLSARLLAQEKATSNQIVILTIKSLDGQELEAYAHMVATTWKLGQKDKDNGILILQSTGDRKIRIETGKGVEGALPDVTCKKIIDTQMIPKFKANKFADGYRAAIDSINLALKGEFKAEAAGGAGVAVAVAGVWAGMPLWLIIVLVVIVAVIVLLALYYGDFGDDDGFSGSGGGYGGGSSDSYSGGGGGFGGGGAGGGY